MQSSYAPKFFIISVMSTFMLSCQLRTECFTGMSACSSDGRATLRCEYGKWVENEVCTEGKTCAEVDTDSLSDEHADHIGEMYMCMTEAEIISGVVDHSDHQQTAGDQAGEHTAGEHTAGEYTAGGHTAGESTMAGHMGGEITAGENIAGEPIAGETTAGEAAMGGLTAGESTAGSE